MGKIISDTKSTTTRPLRPPWPDTGTHTFELAGHTTGDTASDHAIAMQMLEKDWDSYDATIYIDGAATHGNVNGGIIVTTGHVTATLTVSALSQPANCARPSKPKRKLCEQPSNWHRRMSPSTRCASLQIMCQLSTNTKSASNPASCQLR